MASPTVSTAEHSHSDTNPHHKNTHSMDLLADIALSSHGMSDPTTPPQATPRTLPSMQLLPPFSHRPSSKDDEFRYDYRDIYASRPPSNGSTPLAHDVRDHDSDRDRFAFRPPTSESSSSQPAWGSESRGAFSDAYHGRRYADNEDWQYARQHHHNHQRQHHAGPRHDDEPNYERDTRSREREPWGSRHPSPGRPGGDGTGHDYWTRERTGTVERTVREPLPPLQIPNPITQTTHWPRGDASDHPNAGHYASHASHPSHPGRRSSWASETTQPHPHPHHTHHHPQPLPHPSHDLGYLPLPHHPDYTHGMDMSRRASTSGFLAVPDADARRTRSLSADEGVVTHHLPMPPRVTPPKYPTPEHSSPPDATPRKRRPTTSARTHAESRLTTPTPTPTPSFGSRTTAEDTEVDELDDADGEYVPSGYRGRTAQPKPEPTERAPEPEASSPLLRDVRDLTSPPTPAVRTSARLRGRKRSMEEPAEEQWESSPPQDTSVYTAQSTQSGQSTPPADTPQTDGEPAAPKKRKYVRRDAQKRKEQNAAAQKKFRYKKKLLAEQMKTDLEEMERTNAELVAENARLAALLEDKDGMIEHLGAANDALQHHLDTCRCGRRWDGDDRGASHRQGRE